MLLREIVVQYELKKEFYIFMATVVIDVRHIKAPYSFV